MYISVVLFFGVHHMCITAALNLSLSVLGERFALLLDPIRLTPNLALEVKPMQCNAAVVQSIAKSPEFVLMLSSEMTSPGS